MYQKNNFYSKIINNYPDSETAKILKDYPTCDYYEICQSFLDIALNAPIIRNDDGTLSGVFQYKDIDIAKQKTLDFLQKYNISNLDEFFKILENNYPYSASPSDNRRKSGMIKDEKFSSFGYMGTLYFFNHINDNIYSEIIKDIKVNYTNTKRAHL